MRESIAFADNLPMAHRTKPPPLPFEVLARVTRLASIDGRMVMWLSGIFAIMAALVHYIAGATAGCIAAGAGAIEIHGASLLRQGSARGVDWLVRAQGLLLLSILGYCAVRLANYPQQIIEQNLPANFQDMINQAGWTREQGLEMIHTAYNATYVIIAGVSLFYQGAMIGYYAKRRNAIEQALHDGSA